MEAVRSARMGAHEPANAGTDGVSYGSRLLERVLLGVAPDVSPLTHVEVLPARAGRAVPWPDWVPGAARGAFEARGVQALWEHQARRQRSRTRAARWWWPRVRA